MTLNVVILAAGQGKRMFSDRPKVLHQLAGRSLLAHVIGTARALRAERICVVYGHGGEQVPQAIADAEITFVKQEPQLGTGHALKQALPHLGAASETLVLYGDVPLVRSETLKKLLAGETRRVMVLSAELDDPSGYGRVVRDKRGQITSIVEEKDASALQRKIH
jgi:bifunctional UDP-N-acetylglucosamine pyrophosphorylase/glucosamine-1-phosphate N-acetyltransferase